MSTHIDLKTAALIEANYQRIKKIGDLEQTSEMFADELAADRRRRESEARARQEARAAGDDLPLFQP